jgi:hypothetical protein
MTDLNTQTENETEVPDTKFTYKPIEIHHTKEVEEIISYVVNLDKVPLSKLMAILDFQDELLQQFPINPKRVHNRLFNKVNGIITLGGVLLEPIKISCLVDDQEEEAIAHNGYPIDWDSDPLYISSGRHRVTALSEYCIMSDTEPETVMVPYYLTVVPRDSLALDVVAGNDSRTATGTEKDNYALSMHGIDTSSPSEVLRYTIEAGPKEFPRGFSFYIRATGSNKSEVESMQQHTLAVIAKKTAGRIVQYFKDQKDWKTLYAHLLSNREFVKEMGKLFFEVLPTAASKHTNIARNAGQIAMEVSPSIRAGLVSFYKEKGADIFTITQLRHIIPKDVWENVNGLGQHMTREDMASRL